MLEELGSSNYDPAILMKYGINPIEFKEVITEAEYNKETQREQLSTELLKNFATTFGINSVINGFANHYILSPLWSNASNSIKLGGRLGKVLGNPTIKAGVDGALFTVKNNKSILNKPIVRAISGVGMEGIEEWLQEGTNAYSESVTNLSMNNLFADQYNTDNTEYFKEQSYIVGKSLWESVKAMVDPKRGLYAFALGAINTGVMVTPRIGNAQAKSRLGKAIQMRWAPAEMYRDQQDQNTLKEESINAWNEWVANPENKDNLLMVNAAMANEEYLKGQTIPKGATLFDIKNEKLKQIFHAISLAKKAGVSDEYLNTLQTFNSDLTSAINDPTSSKANELVKAAINNGMLSEADVSKPEVVKNVLQQIKDNSSKMLELFPEINKAEKYISEKIWG